MELIYAWIEKFRNIEKVGFHINKNFHVEVSDMGFINSSQSNCKENNAKIPLKRIELGERKDSDSLYGNQIVSLTAIVGKNSVGKSNFLKCIGDIHTTRSESEFVLIYYDKKTHEYIIECNKVAFTINENEGINNKRAIDGITIFRMNAKNKNANLRIDKLEKYIIEFITIAENVGSYLHPNANNSPYDIPRYGLSYKNCGKLHMFKYLFDENSEQSFYNNNINISLELKNFTQDRFKYKLKMLPDKYPNMNCGFDYADKREIYKSLFMLRFFEKVINSMNWLDESKTNVLSIVESEINELYKIVGECKENIEELIASYDKIKKIIIQIRKIFMEKSYLSQTDIESCYERFINQLEKTIKIIDWQSFKYSYKISIDMDVKNDNFNHSVLYELEKTLEYFDESDIGYEFADILDISFNRLSYGLKYLLTVYSTIHKCLKQNPKENYKYIILLLDEPEVHMHPEWSRKLMNDLIKFLGANFKDNNFQIIVSTHSPYILSDVLKDNVIFLKKGEDGNTTVEDCCIATFGANIHDMLKSQIFLTSTMGEFAREQINNVLKFLNGENVENMEKNKAKRIIDNIGEKIIKNKLNKMYYEKFPEEIEDKDRKLKVYQNKVEELYNNISQSSKDNKSKLLSLDKKLKDILKDIGDILYVNGEHDDKN